MDSSHAFQESATQNIRWIHDPGKGDALIAPLSWAFKDLSLIAADCTIFIDRKGHNLLKQEKYVDSIDEKGVRYYLYL
jgi:hypothetical protein